MSLQVTQEDGMIRVHADRAGERAVSDVVDPIELITTIADTMGWDCEVSGNEIIVTRPEMITRA